MKKLLLLLVSGSITLAAHAQERHAVAIPVSDDHTVAQPAQKAYMSRYTSAGSANGLAHKKTAGGSRWYNYAIDVVDTNVKIATGGANSIWRSGAFEWADTNLLTVSTSGARNVNLISVGAIFDPVSYSFNDSTLFEGLMKISSSDAYVVDSVAVIGIYATNPAKTSIVDTVRLSFVKGHGGSETSDDIFSGGSINSTHYGTMNFHDLHYDSVLNYARHGMTWGTPSDNVKDITIDHSKWGDTTPNGLMIIPVQLPTALSVTAGGFAGMSISFKSGDATAPTTTPFDTLSRANNTMKYNDFLPNINYVGDATGTAQWAPAPPAGDHNAGYYKKAPTWANGWSETYLPQFAFFAATGGGAYFYQYPDISWHVTCTTCGVITNNPGSSAVKNISAISTVTAYPNPANDHLSVPFTLSQVANVTVSLNNMLGQVVATQSMDNVTSGKAIFSTSALPAGVYMYTIVANNERSTGHVTIAH